MSQSSEISTDIGAAGTRETEAGDLGEKLKALSHPVRLRMVGMIRERGEVCACEFEGHFDLTQPTLSHHLKALREAGLVTSRRDGVRSLHRIEPEAFRTLARWSRQLAGE